MLAHDLYHSQINILASGLEILRLGEECYRVLLKRQSEVIQQIFNLQSSIFNSGLPGLGISLIQRLKPIHEALIFKLNDIIHQVHHLAGHRAGRFKFPILQAGDRFDFYTRMTGEYLVGV